MVIFKIHMVLSSTAVFAAIVKSSILAFEPPAACFDNFHGTNFKFVIALL